MNVVLAFFLVIHERLNQIGSSPNFELSHRIFRQTWFDCSNLHGFQVSSTFFRHIPRHIFTTFFMVRRRIFFFLQDCPRNCQEKILQIHVLGEIEPLRKVLARIIHDENTTRVQLGDIAFHLGQRSRRARPSTSDGTWNTTLRSLRG